MLSRPQHAAEINTLAVLIKCRFFLAFGVQLIGGLPSQGPKQSTTTWVNSPISLLKCLNTTMTLAPPEPNQQQWLSSVSLPPSLHLPLSRVDLSLSLPLSLSPSRPLSLSLSLTHSLSLSLSRSPCFHRATVATSVITTTTTRLTQSCNDTVHTSESKA